MPGYNLVRNAKAFFTTKLTNGAVDTTLHTASTTFELQVTSGFTFSQGTETQVITVSEAGSIVARSQRTFNTALAPVDFSFSTYIRPKGPSTAVNCEEKVLWNALLSSDTIDTTGLSITAIASQPVRIANSANATLTFTGVVNFQTAAIFVGDVVTLQGITGADATEWNMPATITGFVGGATVPVNGRTTNATATGVTFTYLKAPSGAGLTPTSGGTAFKMFKGAFVQNNGYSLVHSGGSNKNQLQQFGMIIAIDDVTYTIDNCVLDQASVEFGLDGISMVTWTGKGTKLTSRAATVVNAGALTGGVSGNYLQKVTDAQYITQKLSTLTLKSTIRGLGTSAVTYTIPLTGGNLTIANNVTYITPENLGVVNAPVAYYTGTRAITGTLTAYLKSGTNNSGGLLATVLSANLPETKYLVQVEVGGGTSGTRVELEMPASMLQVPTIDAQDVISTSIAFTAQGFDGSSSLPATVELANFDVDQANDLFIRYYCNVA
jgi:hypothetical protein